MATIVERNGRWMAVVRGTFETEAEADRWAAEVETSRKALRRMRPLITSRPTTWYEIQRLKRIDPNEAEIGIYFLFDGEECVYVGQSRQVHTRVREHRIRRKGQFTTYSWVPCAVDELDRLEREYIDLLQPRLNTMWTFDKHRARYDKSTTSSE